MYYDEELILDIRLNSLKDQVDYFVICESKFYHNGNKRDLNFNIENYRKFKDKIIYLVQEKLPGNLRKINSEDNEITKSNKMIFNAHVRENYQRNILQDGILKASEEDLILISDVDEVPNLSSINLSNINPQWLREIKNRDFGFWRLDTLFSKTKYINKNFIKNGGWHFSNIKNAENIELKLNSYLHHRDFQSENIDIKKISSLIKSNETIYDMFADKKSKKFSDNRRYLEIYDFNKLPNYIKKNKNMLKDWLD